MPREQFDTGPAGTNKLYAKGAEDLRKEAENTAAQLVDSLLNMQHPFEIVVRALSNMTTLDILSLEDAAVWADKAHSYALTLAKAIPPMTALPLLLQAATNFYYGPHHEKVREKLPWLGTALKSAFTFVWPNIFVDAEPHNLGVKDFQGLICAVAVWEQLEQLRLLYGVYGHEVVTLTGEGFLASQKMLEAAAETRAVFGERGRLHRTLRDSLEVVIDQAVVAQEAVERILSGENPTEQQIFEGTIFNGIPRQPEEFWAGLWARFHLSLVCVHHCSKPYGLAVFPDIRIAIRTQRKLPADLLQRAIMGVYWNREWYGQRIRQETWNMIVERPVARIRRSPALFVAALPHVADSITWFVEASVMAYPESGGEQLADFVFQKYVSTPFESSVLEIFRKHGYQVGKVTEKGVWIRGTDKLQLKHLYGKKCPGEIDVLAYDPKRNLVLVTECKVLAYPTGLSRLRNLVLKIGDEDSEGFHLKLKRKVEWILATQRLGERLDENTVGMLILDRSLPGMLSASKNLVCDLATLDNVLAHLPF